MEDVHVGQWQTKNSFQSGFSGGLPLAVFDKAMENTIVISPFREFMATSSHLDTTVYPHILQMGVFGRVDSVSTTYLVTCYICTNVSHSPCANYLNILVICEPYTLILV